MAQVTRLRKLKITRVALCRQGIDPDAHILIYKSKDAQPEKVEKREFSAEQRQALADKGHALPDGSFPIVGVGDLRNAIRAFGRAGNKAKAKRHIIKRARALGRTDLIPEGWMAKSKDTNKDESVDLAAFDLEDDVREQLQKMLDDRAAEAAAAAEKADLAEKKVAKLQKTVTTLAEDKDPADDKGDEDDIYKGLPEAVVAKIKDAEARAKRSEETVAKLLLDSRQATFIAKAKTELPKLTEHEELGKALEDIEGRSPEAYKVVERVLKAANAAIDTTKVFSEIGGRGDNSHLGDAMQKIAKMADEIMKSDPKMTRAQAEARVITTHPELYSEASPGHYYES